MKGVSSTTATVLVVALVVVASVATYVWVGSATRSYVEHYSSSEEQLRTLVKVEAASVYDIGDSYSVHVVVRNLGDSNVTVDSIILIRPDGTARAYKAVRPVEIEPYGVGNVIAAVPKSDVDAEHNVCYRVTVASTVGVPASLTLSRFAFTQSPEIVVYLVNVSGRGIRNWGNPRLIYEELKDRANVIVVDTMSELDQFVRNPPDDVIVINSHDEVVPIPPSWGGDWYSYFRAIARDIRDHGWIWVSIQGYPFYYVHNGTDKTTIGVNGSLVVFSAVGASAKFWSGVEGVEAAYATSEVEVVEQVTGIDLPDSVSASRQASLVSGVYLSRVFYRSTVNGKTYYASAAYKFGEGYLIVNGLSGGGSPEVAEKVAKLAAATALYMKLAPTHPYPQVELSVKPPVYVLAVPEAASSWTAYNNMSEAPGTAEEYYDAVRYVCSSLGVTAVTWVNTLEELEEFLWSPPDGIVLVNAHGEAVPIPEYWYSSGGTSIDDYVSVHEGFEGGVAELHAIRSDSGASSFTLYRDVTSVRSDVNGLRVSIVVAPIAPCHSLGVGFCTGTDISDTTKRVVEAEVRLKNNDINNDIDVVIWYNNGVQEDGIGVPEIKPLSWYNLTLIAYSNNTVKLLVYNETSALIGSHVGEMTGATYDSIAYLCLGMWGVGGGCHDASYLVRRVTLSRLVDGVWQEVFDIQGPDLASQLSNIHVAVEQGSGYRWKAFYAVIAWDVYRHGWTWCSVKGYPFYYVSDGRGLQSYPHGGGWRFIKFLIGIDLDKVNVLYGGTGDCAPTTLGEDLLDLMKQLNLLSPIPEAFNVRPIAGYDGVSRVHAYFVSEVDVAALVAVVEAGRGLIVHCGLGGGYTSDHWSVTLSLAVALYEENR